MVGFDAPVIPATDPPNCISRLSAVSAANLPGGLKQSAWSVPPWSILRP